MENIRDAPYSPTPEETRKVLEEYELGVIARFKADSDPEVSPKHIHHHLWDSINRAHVTIFRLERRAFLMGYYKAFGFNALPCCAFCPTSIPEEKAVMNSFEARKSSIRSDLLEHIKLYLYNKKTPSQRIRRTARNLMYVSRSSKVTFSSAP